MPLKMRTGPTLRRQLVRKVRERLAAVFGHEHEVFEAHASVALAIAAGLQRDHVAHHQLVPRAAEPRLLVHVEADAVAEAMEEAVAQYLAPFFVRCVGMPTF